MIFIWDNGEDYSANVLAFIDVPDDLSPEDFAAVKALLDPNGPRPSDEAVTGAYLLGIVKTIEWWHGELVPLADHLWHEDCLLRRYVRVAWKTPYHYPALPRKEDAVFVAARENNPDYDTLWYVRADAVAKLTPSLAARIVEEWRKQACVPEPVIKAMLEAVR